MMVSYYLVIMVYQVTNRIIHSTEGNKIQSLGRDIDRELQRRSYTQ